jgi:hypothetical protein
MSLPISPEDSNKNIVGIKLYSLQVKLINKPLRPGAHMRSKRSPTLATGCHTIHGLTAQLRRLFRAVAAAPRAAARSASTRFNRSTSSRNCISVGSSIFQGGFKVQWDTLSRWIANVDIKVRLLMTFGVLLPPKHQQKRRKLRKDNLRPVEG